MPTVTERPKLAWGPRVDLAKLPNLYEGTSVKPYTPPPAGIDNLGITSTDTFLVPGRGEVQVDFNGYVRVARSTPSAPGWNESVVYTNLIELFMRGESADAGTVIVTLNTDYLSTGCLWTPPADMACNEPAKACRMAVNALFEIRRMGLTLFNKEPILLTINDVRAIPPAGNPGVGRIYEKLPLYNVADPDGVPVADITALKFAMGKYITEDQIRQLRGD